jgi:hypothetical protein
LIEKHLLWNPPALNKPSNLSSEGSMNEGKRKTRNPRLFSILITIGFVFLGSIVGVLIGSLLYTYFIPFWHHYEIDVENRNFSEIVLVDYGYFENVHISQDNVILKADDGKYYSYHQNKWQLTEPPTFDNTKFPHNSPPCSEWPGPPPAVYLRKTKDSVGVEFAHALAITSRCYVLLADGSLHLWTRNYGVFEMMFLGVTSLVIGMVIGGIIGKYVAKRKYHKESPLLTAT